MVIKVLLSGKEYEVKPEAVIDIDGQKFVRVEETLHVADHVNVAVDVTYINLIRHPILQIMKIGGRLCFIVSDYDYKKLMGVVVEKNKYIIMSDYEFDSYFIKDDKLMILVCMDIELELKVEEIVKRERDRLVDKLLKLEEQFGRG